MKLRQYREVPGRHYNSPKEVWGFLLPARPGGPTAVAHEALSANADLLALEGLVLTPRRRLRSRGAWHVIFSQQHLGSFVHRAYVSVHINLQGRVYLIKNRAVPRGLLPSIGRDALSIRRAQHLACRSIRRGSALTVLSHENVWFPVRTRLHLAHKFRVHRRAPAQEWIVYVDAHTGSILSKYDNLAIATGRAHVFDPNPVVALGNWQPLLSDGRPVRRIPAEAYQPARLRGIARSGVLDGSRVSTAPTKHRLQRRDLDFRCRSHEAGFEEVMVYYHLDRAIRYVESLGYRGACALFRRPLEVNARATREDNSWYSPGTRSLAFGVGDVDDAEDGETILHEFGHALQDAICPDFGQSAEAAAMGEGFGDYFAASFFAARRLATNAGALKNAVMTWDGILCPDGEDAGRAPCVRRVDSRLTYESFDHSSRADEHDNGQIWSATLWDIWNEIGRKHADRIIVESHFQLDAFTTFAKGARAILDADRNLFRGRHLPSLRQVFHRRGIGPIE